MTAVAASGFTNFHKRYCTVNLQLKRDRRYCLSACLVKPDGFYCLVQFPLDVFVWVYLTCLFGIYKFKVCKSVHHRTIP